MPVATPLQQRLPDLRARRSFAPSVALCASSDAGVAQPALDLVQRLVRLRRDVPRLGGDAAEDEAEDQHADRRRARAARGSRRRCGAPGGAPASRPPVRRPRRAPSATITGMTIVEVWASSQMTPTMISTKPTSSHDEKPRFLSHVGAENCASRSGVTGQPRLLAARRRGGDARPGSGRRTPPLRRARSPAASRPCAPRRRPAPAAHTCSTSSAATAAPGSSASPSRRNVPAGPSARSAFSLARRRSPASRRNPSSGATSEPWPRPRRSVTTSSSVSASRMTNSTSRTRSVPPLSIRSIAPTSRPWNSAPGSNP